MTNPIGPGTPYQLLFAEGQQEQASLPDPFRQIYPGDWHLHCHATRPYIYTNFAMSRDGRISFNLPGQRAARFVTKSDPHDRWLMGLLRMRSDAVLIGDETIRAEPDYLSSAETIYPDDAAAFSHQRRKEGRCPYPLTVILSAEGRIPEEAQCLQSREEEVIIATTGRGVERAKALPHACQLEVLELGSEIDDALVDLHQLAHLLHDRYQVNTLLCEGGATVFGNMLNARLVDEEFVTWCPTFVGRDRDCFRPSYCEGVAWTPTTAPYSKPIGMHKAGDYFFLHNRTLPQPAAAA